MSHSFAEFILHFNLCSAYLGGRLPCECSSICRYQNLVDIFDSLLDGDSISVSTASTDLKVMGHWVRSMDESKS